MNNIIKVIKDKKCTGCFGCYNSCTFNAIKMKISNEGFYTPEIDLNKCTYCENCTKHCPVLNNSRNTNYNVKNLKVYAGFSLDNSIRKESSSGGIFSELALYVLNNNGNVYGAAWDKDLTVRHQKCEQICDLPKLRSSKYLQSNIGTTYKSVIKDLKQNKKVMFVGVPCQVAALKTFIDSPNLLTVDLVCHGVPSVKVFKKYLDYISKGEKIKSFTFRNKEKGWSNYSTKAIMENGKEYNCITKQDPFFHGFICDLYLNLSCYNCKFAAIPRVGDITIADFWKISDDSMDEKGVSLILENNQKGARILEKLKYDNKIKLYPKTLAEAEAGNPRLKSGKLRIRDNRYKCIHDIDYSDFEEINKKYIKNLIRNVY